MKDCTLCASNDSPGFYTGCIIAADYAAVKAEKFRAQEACQKMGERISAMQDILREFVSAFDAQHAPHLETWDRARNALPPQAADTGPDEDCCEPEPDEECDCGEDTCVCDPR